MHPATSLFWGSFGSLLLGRFGGGLSVLGRCALAVSLAFVVPWVSGLPLFPGFPVAWPLGPVVASLWPAAFLEQF